MIMISLTVFATLVKGWIDFRKYPVTMQMCSIAYSTFEKLVAEIQKYAQGLTLEDVAGFLIKCQTNEETVCDLTPPITEDLLRRYDGMFAHTPFDKSRATVDNVIS